MSLAAAALLTASTLARLQPGQGRGNGRLDLGCGGEGRGQGQVLTAEAPLWLDPGAGPSVAYNSPPAAGGSPVGPPHGSSWDHLSSPTAGAATVQSSEARPDQEQLEQLSFPRGWKLPMDQTICPLRPGVRVVHGGASTRTSGGLATGRKKQGKGGTSARSSP